MQQYKILTHAAVRVINEYCESIPRQVNKLAIACLMAAAGQNQKLIDDHFVRVVLKSEFEGDQMSERSSKLPPVS
jgi:type II secretory pathway predicted ATPase ExeA